MVWSAEATTWTVGQGMGLVTCDVRACCKQSLVRASNKMVHFKLVRLQWRLMPLYLSGLQCTAEAHTPWLVVSRIGVVSKQARGNKKGKEREAE